MISNFGDAGGRLGNQLIRNMTTYLLKEKYGLDCHYEKMNVGSLGLNFQNKQEKKYKYKKILGEDLIIFLLENDCSDSIFKDTNYKIGKHYCQSPKIINHIIKYFSNTENKICKDFINNNKYRSRYNNNNDLFIHIRAGDIFKSSPVIPDYDFFENILKKENYDNLYLASDNFKSNICLKLQNNFPNLIKFDSDQINTILFSVTCNKIILSSGSFSFIIGLFAHYSEKVFISENAGKHKRMGKWHEDYYPEFIKIDDKYILEKTVAKEKINDLNYLINGPYIINLQDTEEGQKRWERIIQEDFYSTIIRFNGIDGRKHDFSKEVSDNIIYINNQHETELGCNLSHYYLWKECENESKPVIILEDDCIVEKLNFKETIEEIINNINFEWDIILLGFTELSINQFFKHSYFNKVFKYFCTHGYILNPKSINKILGFLPMDKPIDIWLSCNIKKGLEIFVPKKIIKGKESNFITQNRKYFKSQITHRKCNV